MKFIKNFFTFGGPDGLELLNNNLKKLEATVNGHVEYEPWISRKTHVPGLVQKIEKLEKENKKLKAIVAELVDYVYKDNK